MRIKIYSDGHRINLRLPTSWLLNRFTARIAAKAINGDREEPYISEESMYALLQGMKRIRRDFRGLTLVEVDSADGDQVRITL